MSRRRSSSHHKKRQKRNNGAGSGNSSASSSASFQQQQPSEVGSTHSSRFTKLLKSVRLYIIATGILVIVVGIVLHAYGKLPSPLVEIAGGYASLIGLIAALWERIEPFIIKLWLEAHRVGVILASVVTVTVLIIIVLVHSVPNASLPPGPLHPTPMIASGSSWVILLHERTPFCTYSRGTDWSIHLLGTFLSCSTSGLVMQQTSASNYAELDLDKVNGSSYDQTTSRVQVEATFQNVRDTTTWAGLFVQIPGVSGGRYVLALDSTGRWQLQYGVSGGKIPSVGQGGQVAIKPSQPTTMMIIYQDGVLYGLINGQYVTSYGVSDDFNLSPNVVGLRVERVSAAMSSSVLYSNFELDGMGGVQ